MSESGVMRPRARLRFLVEMARADLGRLERRHRARKAFLDRLRRYVGASRSRANMPGELARALAGDLSVLTPTVAAVRALVNVVLTGRPAEMKEGGAVVRLSRDRRGVLAVQLAAPLRDIVLRHGIQDLRSGGEWIFARELRIEPCPGCRLPHIRTHLNLTACSKRCRRMVIARGRESD